MKPRRNFTPVTLLVIELIAAMPMLVVIILCMLVAIVLYLLLTPFMVVKRSSNFGLSKQYHAPVQFYLSKFETQHRPLIERFQAYFCSRQWRENTPNLSTVKFWPTISSEHSAGVLPGLMSWSISTYTFTTAAGIFSILEQTGFPRRKLYDFLKQCVETDGSGLSSQQKKDFQRAEEHACNYDILRVLAYVLAPMYWADTLGYTKEFRVPAGVRGRMIIAVHRHDLNWILREERILIVPMDWPSYRSLSQLCRIGLLTGLKHNDELPALSASRKLVDLR